MPKRDGKGRPRPTRPAGRRGINHSEPATIPSLGTMPELDVVAMPVQRDAAQAFAAFCEQHGYHAPRAAAGALIWFTELDADSRVLTKDTLHEWEQRRHREAKTRK